ncbi:hypothetical protein BROOK1789B_229 [Bathymodiolus brooksi thiotrophic gill symbiont]|nr:hypothetical protein BROOK1789B_229 [Bathymodiolus brooksi thiotrophic gill symbiont]
MNNKLSMSKIYLTISLGTYLLSLFATWYYFYAIWLSLGMSVLFSLWLVYFLPRAVWLSHPNSIVKISLEKDRLTLEKNDHSTQQYSAFYPVYQSRFLLIINAGKESVVIFKDALAPQSLSQFNRYFNTQKNANT